jgi:hypothetical protein
MGLKRTATSIGNQSKRALWIIVTPKEKSETRDYAQHLKELGLVSEIFFDTGQGVYSAMNKVVNEICEEDWVWFLNAGDEFAKIQSFEIACNYAQDTEYNWIYGGHILGSQNFRILGEVKSPEKFLPANQLFSKKYISHQSVIFKVKFLQELGGFRETYKIAADWDLMVRASALDPGLRVPEALSIFYMGGLSTSARQLANKELFELRKIHLNSRYRIKNYCWFCYRQIRNRLVLSYENRFPHVFDAIRKIRLMLKFQWK